MEQINSAFGFQGLTVDIPRQLQAPTRLKRQLAIISTMVVTSLLTNFSTKKLVSMAQDHNEDLYDSSNNSISAIKNHESRITRLEESKDQLEWHLDKITDQMLLGIPTESTFFGIFGASTLSNSLSWRVKDIQTGMVTLLTTNKLHPSVVSWGEAKEGILRLRQLAVNRKKIIVVRK